MLLDPRQYRIDELLRRAYAPGVPFGPSGENLWAASPQGWGFPGGVHYGRAAATAGGLAPLTLDVLADGDPVTIGDAISRPSHVTLHGRHPGSGLQVTEDKFLTEDDVAVSVLSLRNPGETSVEVRVEHAWGVRQGENDALGDTPVWVRRDAPPGDDLLQRLPSGGRRTLVFSVAFAATREQAFRRAGYWREHPDPVRTQAESYQAWFDENVPRFDCPDPWLTRLWYHRWQSVRRLRGETQAARDAVRRLAEDAGPGNPSAALARYARAQFVAGDFARPGPPEEDAAGRGAARGPQLPALADYLVYEAFGVSTRGEDTLLVTPRVTDVADGGWAHFCVEGVACRGRSLTLVWDDPAERSVDAYSDGDKGFTVYGDGRRIHHQERLEPVEVEMPL